MEQTANESFTLTLDKLNEIEANQRLPVVVFIGVTAIFGACGNLNVLILFRRKDDSNYKTFVTILSVTDIFGCCVSMPFEIADNLLPYKFYNATLCRIFRFHNTFLTISSVLCLVVIAIERHRKICHPMKKQFTVWNSRIFCFGAMLTSGALSWPPALFNGHRTVDLPGNITGSDCSTNDEYRGSLFYTIYSIMLFVSFIAFSAIVIFAYISIIIKIKQQEKKRVNLTGCHKNIFNSMDKITTHDVTLATRGRTDDFISWLVDISAVMKGNASTYRIDCPTIHSTKTDKKHSKGKQPSSRYHSTRNINSRRITKILFLITFVFIFSYLPYLVLEAIVAFDTSFDLRLGEVGTVLYRIGMRLFYVNSTINPLVFTCLDPNVKEELKSIYRCTSCNRKVNA